MYIVRDIDNKEEFDNLVKSNNNVLILFYAEWCSLGKSIYPLLDELETRYGQRMMFCKIDIDENGEMVEYFGINALPIILFMNKGEIVHKLIGAQSKDGLEEAIQLSLNKDLRA